MKPVIIKLEDHGSNTTGFISWTRLQELFHDLREMKPHERIVRVEVDESGIRYYVADVR